MPPQIFYSLPPRYSRGGWCCQKTEGLWLTGKLIQNNISFCVILPEDDTAVYGDSFTSRWTLVSFRSFWWLLIAHEKPTPHMVFQLLLAADRIGVLWKPLERNPLELLTTLSKWVELVARRCSGEKRWSRLWELWGLYIHEMACVTERYRRRLNYSQHAFTIIMWLAYIPTITGNVLWRVPFFTVPVSSIQRLKSTIFDGYAFNRCGLLCPGINRPAGIEANDRSIVDLGVAEHRR